MVKTTTIVIRSILLVIGILGAITGLVFGFSNGQINLIPIPGLTYANPLSGIVIGAIGFLLALTEASELYRRYQQTKGNMDTQQSKK